MKNFSEVKEKSGKMKIKKKMVTLITVQFQSLNLFVFKDCSDFNCQLKYVLYIY